MTETVMQADCGPKGDPGPWRTIAIKKLIPISPRDCLNISDSGKATLFDRAVTLTRNCTGMRTLEERINCDARGQSPIRRSSEGPGRAHVQLTVRRIAVWKRAATTSQKRSSSKGSMTSSRIMWREEWTLQRVPTSGTTSREAAPKRNGKNCTKEG